MKPNQKNFLSKFELGLEVWVRVCESECVSGSVGRKGLIFNKEKKNIFMSSFSFCLFFLLPTYFDVYSPFSLSSFFFV